jgi:hypothetical protein
MSEEWPGKPVEDMWPGMPQESQVIDAAKSLRAGVAGGAAGTIGTAGDVQQALAHSGIGDWLTNKVRELFPNYAAYAEKAGQKYGHLADRGDVAGPVRLPTTEEVKKATKLGEFDYTPQTELGSFLKPVGEFVPGAVTGGVGSVRQAARSLGRYAVLPGVAGEGAGQLAEYGGLPEGKANIVRAIASIAAPALAPRAISPFVNRAPEASREAYARAVGVLEREGVPVTAGQRADNQGLKYLESQLNPDHAKEMLQGYTQAATRTAGQETPVLQHGAGGTVQTLRDRVGTRFDQLQANNTLTADLPLVQDFMRIRNEYTRVPGAYSDRAVAAATRGLNQIGDNLVAGGTRLTGDQYQRLRSTLNKAAMGTEDAQHSQALHDIIDSLDNAMERSIARTNPADAGEWGRARDAYKRALVLEHAASAAGQSPARGYITPAQLERASKAVYGTRAHEVGHSPFSELSNSGAQVLGAMPDSGTAHRAWVNNLFSFPAKVAAGAAGYFGGKATGLPEGGIAGLISAEMFGAPIIEQALRSGARTALFQPTTQRYIGNQAAAGAHRLREDLPGLLTILQAERQYGANR